MDNCKSPFNDLVIDVLCQTAKKFGAFKESECSMVNKFSIHQRIIENERCVAVFGLNTFVLCFEGSWRFFFYQKGQIIEVNKQKLLNHFGFNYNQMQLLLQLTGRYCASNSEDFRKVCTNKLITVENILI